MTKISIEEKRFDEALIYLNEINKNSPKHKCRTGLFPDENGLTQLYEIIQINLK